MSNPLAPVAAQVEISPEHSEALCVRKISQLKSVKAKLKHKNEMLKSSLENDSEYSSLQEKVKEARQVLKERKASLMQEPMNNQLALEIRELRMEKKETQLSLFDSIGTYVAATNSYEIQDDEGETHTIRREFKISKI